MTTFPWKKLCFRGKFLSDYFFRKKNIEMCSGRRVECSRLMPILDSGNFRVESCGRKKNVSNILIWTFVDISTPFGGRVLDMNNTNFSRPLINAIWELKISKDKKKKSKEIKREKKETSNSRGGRRYLPYVFTEQGIISLWCID